MGTEVMAMGQEQVNEPFSAEMEARVCEIVMGDRRHGLQ